MKVRMVTVGIILTILALLTVTIVYAAKLNSNQTVGTADNSSIQTVGNDKTGNSIIIIGHE
jgi:archaellum component FlaF (FlaF/FlaG flagellin family)